MRTYWWFVAIIPAFGLVLLLFGPGVMKAMGLMAALWPLSLPARAIFATSKTGKLLEKGAWASLEEDILYLHGNEGGGFKLGLSTVRRTEQRRGFFILVLARGAFVAIPLAATDEAFLTNLKEARNIAIRNKEDGQIAPES